MIAERDENHDVGGRFKAGNKAARGRRSPVRTPEALIEIIEGRLQARNSERTLTEYVGDCFLRLISAAGDGGVKAATYVVDKLYPIQREPMIGRKSLPSPTGKPLQFLDAISRCVVQGKMTTAQAARLANLTKPLVVDEQLRKMMEEIAELKKTVDELAATRLRSVR